MELFERASKWLEVRLLRRAILREWRRAEARRRRVDADRHRQLMKTDPLYRKMCDTTSEPLDLADLEDLEDNARRYLAHWRRPYP